MEKTWRSNPKAWRFLWIADSMSYDFLGRVQSQSNALGTFQYTTVGLTRRLAHVDYPNGIRTQYGYMDVADDSRLSEIKNYLPASNTVVSQYDYLTRADGEITQWTEINPALANPQQYSLGYDNDNWLTSAQLTNASSGNQLHSYAYGYDDGGNRLSEQIDGLPNAVTVNDLNQLTQDSPSQIVAFSGSTNVAASVAVNGTSAPEDGNFNFSADVLLSTGSNTVVVTATTATLQTGSSSYGMIGPASHPFSYDDDGNLTSDGINTYEWDAANRLVSITYGSGASTTFKYDGIGHSTRIIETGSSGVVTGTTQFVWCPGDSQPSEERDGNNNIMKRFYSAGEQISGTNYYYTKDHLGSIRELTDASGNVQARYDYDLWGRQTQLSGTIGADFGYTGFYMHPASGLELATFRAYNPNLGKWISRDPLRNAEMSQGPNLYQYVGNDPISRVDPRGEWYVLNPVTWFNGSGYEGVSGGWDAYDAVTADAFAQGAYAALDGLDPFGNPFADNGFYDPCDEGSQISHGLGKTAQLALITAGGLSASQALNGYFMPSTLYHFTSLEGAAAIESTGIQATINGLYGTGTYLTGFNSAFMATIQGAVSTETAITVSTEGLTISPTYFPGTYIIRGASLLLK